MHLKLIVNFIWQVILHTILTSLLPQFLLIPSFIEFLHVDMI